MKKTIRNFSSCLLLYGLAVQSVNAHSPVANLAVASRGEKKTATAGKFIWQATPVRGKVTATEGTEGLIGVSVGVKGTTLGTLTDAAGNYALEVNDANAILVFSYIGYQTQEVALNGRATVNVQLAPSTETLEEVVVVGYGTQKKENLTGSVATVNAKELESRPLTNLGQGLQGLVPNLNITRNTGAPGQGANFNIRGNTSINGGSPLVLVDGVQMDPNLINPDDVESVTILKDAASAAIYGVRGAYGVILITTKRPKKDAPLSISYSGNYTLTRPTRMPEYLNSVDYIRMHREADRNGRISGGSVASEGFTRQDSLLAQAYLSNPAANSPVYPDPGNPSKYRYVGNTDWIEELYPGWAPQMQHNLSAAGGQGKTSFVASLGYFDQKGLLKVADETYDRYNAGLKVNTEAASWLDLNFRMTLNHVASDKPTPANHGGLSTGWISGDLRPIMPVYHPDGNYAGQGSFTNTVALARLNGRTTNKINDLWLTGGLVARPVKNVSLTADYTWNPYTANYQQHYKEYSEYGVDGVFLGVFPWSRPSRLIRQATNDNYFALNAYANYENTFGAQHYFKATVGYNQELKQINNYSASVKNLIDQTLPAINLNNDDKPIVGGQEGEWALSGTFFRLNYIFRDKYLLEVNGRYDGTSRFPSDNRYTFLPSVSAGWRLSEEEFFSGLKGIVNDLKLRASYGTLGNQQLGAGYSTANYYPYLPTMSAGQIGHIFGNGLGVAVNPPGLVSTAFTWEKVTSKNIGLDLGVLDNRLTTSFDWYIRDTKDMITGGFPLPAVLGTAVPSKNAADLRTRGWELSLNWRDDIGEDFSYDVALALSDNTSEITRFELNPNKTIGNFYEGFEFGEIWGYETAGYFQTDDEASAADQSRLWNGTWMAGDIRYRDLNGDGKINPGASTVGDPGDRKIIGNSSPRYAYGLNLGLRYKGFDFGAFIQGIGKRDLMLGGNYFWGFGSEWDVPMVYHTDYWRPDNTGAEYPRLRFGGGGNFQTQTKYLQNAAYMRLKNLTLGYSLPATWINKVKMQRLRVYVSGENILEFTQLHEAFDPEIPNARDYPLNRALSFGLQLGL